MYRYFSLLGLILVTPACFAVSPESYTFILSTSQAILYQKLSGFVWLVVMLGGIAVYSELIKVHRESVWSKILTNPFLVFYIIFCLSMFLTGLFGFLTKTYWGLFELSPIPTAYYWRLEVRRFAIGFIGLLAYFIVVNLSIDDD